MNRADRRRAKAVAKNKRPRTDIQPKAGDVMWGCEHGPDARVSDVLYYPDGVSVNGAAIKARHFVLCAHCFSRYKKEGIQSILFRYQRVWRAEDGTIRFAENS